MNDNPGSTLQKASFVLLVLIAAALAYLIVRDRVRANRVSAEMPATLGSSSSPAPAVATSRAAEMKSSFTPLRSRNATDTGRVATGQRIFAGNSVQSAIVSSPDAVEAAPLAAILETGAPVPAATTLAVATGRGTIAAITGRVTLRGIPPPEKAITLDAMCGRLHPAPMFTRHFVIGREGGLGNVFVYIKTGAPKDDSRQEAMPVLDNVACEFQPYILGVRARQPFTLRNSDPVLHNMHMLTKPGSRNREVNIGMPVRNASSTKVFDQAEIFIKVKCDVHPWMFAYIGVVEHRWFAVTDGDGNFALPTALPAGQYTIAAMHLKAGEQTRQITVGEGVEPVNFVLDVPEALAKAP
jgi:hypothetical protein